MIAASRIARRPTLPDPGDTIEAPRDLKSDESGFWAVGMLEVGAPRFERVTIASIFLRVLLFVDLTFFADLSAFSVALGSFALFVLDPALEPPDGAGGSRY